MDRAAQQNPVPSGFKGLLKSLYSTVLDNVLPGLARSEGQERRHSVCEPRR
jgi:hypothetical protein